MILLICISVMLFWYLGTKRITRLKDWLMNITEGNLSMGHGGERDLPTTNLATDFSQLDVEKITFDLYSLCGEVVQTVMFQGERKGLAPPPGSTAAPDSAPLFPSNWWN